MVSWMSLYSADPNLTNKIMKNSWEFIFPINSNSSRCKSCQFIPGSAMFNSTTAATFSSWSYQVHATFSYCVLRRRFLQLLLCKILFFFFSSLLNLNQNSLFGKKVYNLKPTNTQKIKRKLHTYYQNSIIKYFD